MLVTKKDILVGLDGSQMDQTLISFINYILLSSPVEHIYFLNVINKVQHLADDGIQAKKIDEAAIRIRKEKLGQKIKEGIKNHSNAEMHIEVIKGNPVKEFLQFMEEEDIDIVITGRKKDLAGGGVLNKKTRQKSRLQFDCHSGKLYAGIKKAFGTRRCGSF